MSGQLKESAQRFESKLRELGCKAAVIELPDDARTAQAAAEAIGCDVAQIAKSIVFRLERADKPLLVIASGVNRINEKRIGERLNDKLSKADAEYVRRHTGYVIGGVPPLAHTEPILTLIDEDLFQYRSIWAAAGHPKAVFSLTPEQLADMTKGQVTGVK